MLWYSSLFLPFSYVFFGPKKNNNNNNNPVTQINSAKSPVFWPVKSKIYSPKIYALKVIKASDQIEIEH